MTTWYQRIRAAMKRGHFTQTDEDLAEDWSSCMMSERPNTRHWENDPEAPPISQRLDRLGMEFLEAVSDDDPYRALEIRAKILGKPRPKS